MPARQCYHCKQWIDEGEEHDCWTTTEAALTQHLPEHLREAWERLRETAISFGDQRVYASHHSIMFSRKSCYFFVRPRQDSLELCIFLGCEIDAPQVRRIDRSSKTKLAHTIRVVHRDEVEPPLTTWLQEAYEFCAAPQTAGRKSKPEAKVKPSGERGPAPKLDKGTQLNRVRRICAAIPGTIEKVSHGEPTFFTPQRVFAMFANNHHGDGRVAIWIPAAPGVQSAFIEESPDTYFKPPYVGVNGWVGVELSRVDDTQLGSLLREAFRLTTAKAKAPGRVQSSSVAGRTRSTRTAAKRSR